MNLIRFQPFQEIDRLHREMNRLFDDARIVPDRLNGNFVPSAEIEETSEAVLLKLEVPGIDAKDIEIQATAEAVSISGERKSEKKAEEGSVKRSEFYYGSFQRIIPLPVRIQNTNITAEYTNGILNLTLPKAEEEKNKVVKVNLN
ncbi:MAG: Hsp20/alpha crystallin family protein [Cyanobacteria bacterium SBLK]|nr:Hsp20/alpha crystallin family protein [Cyanobacteria bacterium SBLK]